MNECCRDEENWTFNNLRQPLICTVCGTVSSDVAPPKPTNPHGDLHLVLKRSSWENLFLQIHEHGLAPIHPERLRMLGDKGIFDTTEGNFWSALGELERQFQVQTGQYPKIKFE